MADLKLDGIGVKTSSLTQKAHKAAVCDLLLEVTTDNFADAIAEFTRVGAFGPYSGLSLNEVEDLSFLSRFPDLLYLEIRGSRPAKNRHLDCLSNLRGLYLETPGEGVDFSCHPQLEVFVGGWHPDNQGLAASDELRRLRVRKFNPAGGDLTALAGITRLEDLAITQTNVTSLTGLEALPDLRYFKIAYAPKLATLEAVAASTLELRELSIVKAKKIRSYAPLSTRSRLRRLWLSDCAAMENLEWIAGLDNLDFFSFVETDVLSGDLGPLLELPRLRYAGTLDRKHYNYKWKALNEALKGRTAQTAR